MRTVVIVAVLVLLLALAGMRLLHSRSGPASGWPTNFADALAQAKSQNKIVLANFTGSDWCGYCIQLRDEVFSTPDFRQWAADKLVLVEIDFPESKPQPQDVVRQNQQLQQQFGVSGYPTILFLAPDGKELGRITGYEGKTEWLAEARRIVSGR